ncbi:MAG: hypothetical protein ABIB11_03250, partial [Candidatus Omnitrophota bacterium]
LRILPEHMIEGAKKLAEKASKVLGLNYAGIDVMLDRNLKTIYVIDVNVFPGFPKRKTFNLTKHIVEDLSTRVIDGKVEFLKF